MPCSYFDKYINTKVRVNFLENLKGIRTIPEGKKLDNKKYTKRFHLVFVEYFRALNKLTPRFPQISLVSIPDCQN